MATDFVAGLSLGLLFGGIGGFAFGILVVIAFVRGQAALERWWHQDVRI